MILREDAAVGGSQVTQRDGPARRDALTRREALINAAMECFIEDGFGVPLERIAERAGVGRGTLYRNFQDRTDLALAIFSREIDAIAERVDPGLPLEQALAAFVREGRRATAIYVRLAADLPLQGERRAAFEALALRAAGVLQPFVARWHAEGTLDPAIDGLAVLVATRMVSGLFLRPEAENIDAELAAAVALVVRGLAPRG
jgi:AcrR family transcriptional regulator